MKKLTSLVLASLLLISTAFAQKVTIEGTVTNAGDGTTAYLSRVEGNQLIMVDSMKVDKKGRLLFTSNISKPTLHLLKFKGMDNIAAHLMVDPGDKISIETELVGNGSFIHLSKASGSRNITVYQQFNDILYQNMAELNALNNEMSQPTISGSHKQELSAQFQQRVASQNNSIAKLLTDNSDVLICAFLVTYFDEDAEKYLNLFETVHNGLKGKYPDNQFVQYLENKLRSTLGPGRMAPEIEMKDPNGKTRKLSDLRGKVVMIDFWASWCSPCRMENPNVVKLYKKYHDKGFDIYSVSLDRTHDAWVRAIQQDGLEWENHVSDLKGWTSSGGASYGIKSVPSTVLVDRDGRIIARNLRGQELANKLKEIFGE